MPQLRQILTRPDLRDCLLLNVTGRDDGLLEKVYDGQGWRDGVLNDEEFVSDRRNIALSFATDGTQIFKHSRRTMWPLLLEVGSIASAAINWFMQVLNLHEHLRHLLPNVVFAGVVPGPDKPKNLATYADVLVDELLQLWAGVDAVDHKDQQFTLRAKLLFHRADYPGHSLITMLQDAGLHGCMKCHQRGVYKKGLQRTVYCDHRRFLPADHKLRVDPEFGDPEHRPRPLPRQHEEVKLHAQTVDAARNMGIRHDRVNDPTSASGVLGFSAFLRLPYYNLLDGLALDYMHIMKDVVRHLIDTMKGERTPKLPRKPKKASKDSKESKDGKDSKAASSGTEHKHTLAEYQAAVEAHTNWTLSKDARTKIDERYRALQAPTGFIDRSHSPFQYTGLVDSGRHKYSSSNCRIDEGA